MFLAFRKCLISICLSCEKAFLERKISDPSTTVILAVSMRSLSAGAGYVNCPQSKRSSFLWILRMVISRDFRSTKRHSYTGVQYRKYIKGHITVFPNDVLPHPLLKKMESINGEHSCVVGVPSRWAAVKAEQLEPWLYSTCRQRKPLPTWGNMITHNVYLHEDDPY
jgi:hypothetical protein